jgi:tRNA pseudouridine13 synthase
MQPVWPRAWGVPGASCVYKSQPEDFVVHEHLGFDLSGEGEHVLLHLEKRGLNTLELEQRVSRVSGVSSRDIGLCGMKDRNAVTRQWLSVGMAGKPEPDWRELENNGEVKLLAVDRHTRKLRRGVHKANRFQLRLTRLRGDIAELEARLEKVAKQGVPNYFGEQRFGRQGQTLAQARQWMSSSGRKLTRTKRSFYLSALRSFLFNELLAARVREQSWNTISDGDVCMLHGTRSRFSCELCDEDIRERAAAGDLHAGLPLWGGGRPEAGSEIVDQQALVLADSAAIGEFLEQQGLDLDYRSARLIADDFCWQFCDDDCLQLNFSLAPGAYATVVLAELVNLTSGETGSGNGSE